MTDSSGAPVVGATATVTLAGLGVSVIHALGSVALMCLVAAWLAWKLHLACETPAAA